MIQVWTYQGITRTGDRVGIWSMWLARHDNLPPGCLAKHLWRILQ